jgi:hypothetical protein
VVIDKGVTTWGLSSLPASVDETLAEKCVTGQCEDLIAFRTIKTTALKSLANQIPVGKIVGSLEN